MIKLHGKGGDAVHMTLEADYAVRIVGCLTQAARRCDAAYLAEQTQVPLRFSLKILRKLVQDGLVVSYKGARGGYCLARPASEITLRQVLEAVEGPYVLSRCQRDEGCCPQMHSCRFSAIYAEISELVREKLDAHTFAELCSCGTDQQKCDSST